MFVLDSHCDTPSQILRLRDLSIDNDHAHVDFPKLKRGGVDGAFFALYVPSRYDDNPDAGFAYAGRLLDGVRQALAENKNAAKIAASCSDAARNQDEGLFSVFLGLENGSPIGRDLDRLRWFYDCGIRYVTLCHSGHNQICDSCAPVHPNWNGLSPFGRDVVREMNGMGMLIDVSHMSDPSFYDVIECSTKPVAATHSCCRALADHPRNMTDAMIKHLADAGGVIQINFYPVFLDGKFKSILLSSGLADRAELIENEFIANPADLQKRYAWNKVQDELKSLARPSFRRVADHIDHAVEIAGIDHVGIGSDFDGIEVAPDGLDDISMMPVLFDELRSRGYRESDIAKIAGGNFLRILD